MVEWLKTSQTFLFGSSLRIITGPPFELKIYQCILNRNILQISCQSNFPSKIQILVFNVIPECLGEDPFGVLDQFYDYRPLSLLRPSPSRFGKRGD